MKSQYGGFRFSIGTKTAVYSPSSVISFLAEPERGFLNYWHSYGRGVPEVLIKYLENTDFRDLFNKLSYRMKEGILIDYRTDRDMLPERSEPDQIPLEMLLYQTGYFTLRQESRSYARLDIPNDAVLESLIKLSLDVNYSNPFSAARSKLAETGDLADSGDIAGIFDLFNGVLSPEADFSCQRGGR
ncbi:MAG: hypothetical protein II922_11965 [Succinimonas sp.]|nr:hypothetical protein [Succinimonas sp.]